MYGGGGGGEADGGLVVFAMGGDEPIIRAAITEGEVGKEGGNKERSKRGDEEEQIDPVDTDTVCGIIADWSGDKEPEGVRNHGVISHSHISSLHKHSGVAVVGQRGTPCCPGPRQTPSWTSSSPGPRQTPPWTSSAPLLDRPCSGPALPCLGQVCPGPSQTPPWTSSALGPRQSPP
ncbi:hypothetical protein NHX12_028464 [Muraenolepis orangiensis]|uniref:Uncharacterized protein n=1 Tax=Muraenolepis orangiensis TaxID=630683 RepID=A0A9Q0EDS6_9TELE|nr:hypothetical protein NHX12_028464 [Muraenolepis orangiensis]